MTDFQAKQIRELRLRGAGYKSIASAVGLSRDTVRNYCKSHGLDGYASALVLNVKEQMESGTACLCCGKELIQPSTGRKDVYKRQVPSCILSVSMGSGHRPSLRMPCWRWYRQSGSIIPSKNISPLCSGMGQSGWISS